MTDTTTTTGELATLVAEGNAALIAGDSYSARQRFRQALALDPRHVGALIGLAGSVRPYREKREHLIQALAIEPDHAEARAVLAQVEARIAAGEILAPGGVQVGEQGAAAPPAEPPVSAPSVDTLVCYNHPDRETGLRCISCERPICAECVRPAAVGQLCPECARARRPVNYQVGAGQIVIAAVAALIYGLLVTLLGSLVLGMVGFFGFIIAFLLGPVAGDLLARLIDRLTHNKRGRPMQLAAGICYTLGALFWIAPTILLIGRFPLSLIVFTIATVATVVARMR